MDPIALGGPVPDVAGGWDWWVLLCIPLTYACARRLVGSPRGLLTAILSVAVGTALADLIRARGLTTAATVAVALTIVGLLVRRSLSPQPPSV